MSSFFYQKLAITNLRKNSKTYVPYILTCIGTVIMFYNMCALSFNSRTQKSDSVASMMILATLVIGIFATVFLFYTNSFLVKRRKKEFGLFNILGMEKKHIGKVMFWETLFVSAISIVVGVLLGIVLSKFITLILYKILQFDFQFSFEINVIAILVTVGVFIGIFLMILINILIQVHFVKTIELLKGSNVGEREPKTNWMIAIIGLITLGGGYFVAVTRKEPLAAMGVFFYAAILVIIGTYCLFTAGSIALLKTLKKNKSYYYKTKNFVSLSGMIYRMKQNAIGLANICILSTAVLVMLSTTVSMYVGIKDTLNKAHPRDISVLVQYVPEEGIDKKAILEEVNKICKDNNVEVSNTSILSSLDYGCNRDGNKFINGDSNYVSISNSAAISFITVEEYERISGERITLNDDEVLLYNKDNTIGSVINIFNRDYRIREKLGKSPVEIKSEYEIWNADYSCVVLANDDVMNELCKDINRSYGEYAGRVNYDISFDVNKGGKELAKSLETGLDIDGLGNVKPFNITSKEAKVPEFYELYGSLLFLGIFLGGLFLMGTVLIIYYKQVVEGFEDKERYRIMQNVGMSKEEVKKSIRSQVLTVFALPIVVAIIHIFAAFPIMTKMLALLSLTNVSLFIICTIATVLIFIAIYILVYILTARVYYNIVN